MRKPCKSKLQFDQRSTGWMNGTMRLLPHSVNRIKITSHSEIVLDLQEEQVYFFLLKLSQLMLLQYLHWPLGEQFVSDSKSLLYVTPLNK